MNEIKLNLGCGTEHLPGYINIDAHPSEFVDKVCDCTKLLDFQDNSIDEIVAYHFLEHLKIGEIFTALIEWRRILKGGGKLIIECPDLEKVCAIFVNATDIERYKSWNNGPALFNHIYGCQHHPFDYHKFGFTKSFMSSLLQNLNFQNVYFGESHRDYRVPCIHVECIKG